MTPIIGTAPTRTESSELLADPNWLRREYVENGRTYRDIANEIGCGRQTVCRALDRHGILARPVGPKARQIDRVMGDAADEFAQITDEMVARLRQDKVNHPPSYAFVAQRIHIVNDTAKAEGEPYAERMALIELASAALLVADSKTPRR